jgi:hypothetical protein
MNTATAPQTATWSRGVKALASVLILYHLLAVFWAPFRFAATAPSGLGSPFANYPDKYIFEWYYQPLFLDHGYSFFAPNPGPTHVLDFRVFDASGDVIHEGRLPDLKLHDPRLRYHRFFMLAESLNGLWVPPEGLDVPRDDEDQKFFVKRRNMYLTLKEAVEQGLARKFGGSHAVVERVEHRAPTVVEFRDLKWSLTDERLFTRLPERAPREQEEIRP